MQFDSRAGRPGGPRCGTAGATPATRALPASPVTGPAAGQDMLRRHALRANWAETVLALLGAAGIVGSLTKTSMLSGPLLAGLLFVPTLGMGAAPSSATPTVPSTRPPRPP